MYSSAAIFSLLTISAGIPSVLAEGCQYQPDMQTWLHLNCYVGENGVAVGINNPCCFIKPPLTRISADKAFDAYQDQEMNGRNGVVLVDVRTPEEVYWVGQPAQAKTIRQKDGSGDIVPDHFKTVLKAGGMSGISSNNVRGLRTTAQQNGQSAVTTPTTPGLSDGSLQYGSGDEIEIGNVEEVVLEPISYNIPVEYMDDSFETVLNPNFGSMFMQLFMSFGQKPPASIIFYCRSGQRSSVGCFFPYCYQFLQIDQTMFTFYEVEAADSLGNEINGNGGFEGSSFKNKYNGYRGFPGREGTTSVDFKDAGLPIVIGKKPLKAENGLSHGLPWACKDSLKKDQLGLCY